MHAVDIVVEVEGYTIDSRAIYQYFFVYFWQDLWVFRIAKMSHRCLNRVSVFI